jgi:hypothetical protein
VTDRNPCVAVISTSSTLVEKETARSLEEMIFDTTTDALSGVGYTIEDIDAIVISGNDEIDGRVISIMAGAGPAGGVGRDTTLIASSADHALVYGYLRVLAGQGKRVLVVGWAKPSESVDVNHAELVEAEPYILRNVGMNHTVAAALQASLWLDEPESGGPVVCWPLTASDLPKRGDAVHALVLAREGAFPEGTELAWISDCGWATSTYELGARDLRDVEPLGQALAQIDRRGVSAPRSAWRAVEIAAESEPAVRRVAALLGLKDTAAVNASGSLADTIGVSFVAGLGRMVSAVEAVAAAETPIAVAGIGFNGYAEQGATVVVFSGEKGGNG